MIDELIERVESGRPGMTINRLTLLHKERMRLPRSRPTGSLP